MFVRARGDLYHSVEEGALGGAAAVVVPLVFEAVVRLVVRAGVEQPDAVFCRPPERGVFPVAAGEPSVGVCRLVRRGALTRRVPPGRVPERRGDAGIAGVFVHVP